MQRRTWFHAIGGLFASLALPFRSVRAATRRVVSGSKHWKHHEPFPIDGTRFKVEALAPMPPDATPIVHQVCSILRPARLRIDVSDYAAYREVMVGYGRSLPDKEPPPRLEPLSPEALAELRSPEWVAWRKERGLPEPEDVQWVEHRLGYWML